MDAKTQKTISKFMSLVLRHQPDVAAVTPDSAGWVGVGELLAGMASAGRPVTPAQLEEIVLTNDKQRFQFSDDGTQIRATQGHSVNVSLGYEPAAPPEILYHGTPEQFLAPIRREGLLKQKRHHVHLHENARVASGVGRRRGQPVVLTIAAQQMSDCGHVFFVTPNSVWLTDSVPPEFIVFPE